VARSDPNGSRPLPACPAGEGVEHALSHRTPSPAARGGRGREAEGVRTRVRLAGDLLHRPDKPAGVGSPVPFAILVVLGPLRNRLRSTEASGVSRSAVIASGRGRSGCPSGDGEGTSRLGVVVKRITWRVGSTPVCFNTAMTRRTPSRRMRTPAPGDVPVPHLGLVQSGTIKSNQSGGWSKRLPTGSSGVVRGTTTHGTCAPRTGTGTIRATGTTTWAFAAASSRRGGIAPSRTDRPPVRWLWRRRMKKTVGV
jgi:hypothetical protein